MSFFFSEAGLGKLMEFIPEPSWAGLRRGMVLQVVQAVGRFLISLLTIPSFLCYYTNRIILLWMDNGKR